MGAAQLNDPNVFLQAGLLTLNVLNVQYVTVPGMVNFPARSVIDLSAAIASNSATTAEVGAALGQQGREVTDTLTSRANEITQALGSQGREARIRPTGAHGAARQGRL